MHRTIYVPIGAFASEEDEAAERRRKLAQALMAGDEISVTPSGNVLTEDEGREVPAGNNIVVPEGKLAKQ